MRTLPVAIVLSFAFAAVAGAQPPRIDAVTPAQAPIAGGTVVTVTGSAFDGATVTLDGSPIVPSAQSSTRIEFTAPAHDNGYALVRVATADGLYRPRPNRQAKGCRRHLVR